MKLAKDFSKEEKGAIVKRLLAGEELTTLAEEYGTKESVLQTWRYAAMNKKPKKKEKKKSTKGKKISKKLLQKSGLLEKYQGDAIMSNLLQQELDIASVEVLRDKIILHLT